MADANATSATMITTTAARISGTVMPLWSTNGCMVTFFTLFTSSIALEPPEVLCAVID